MSGPPTRRLAWHSWPILLAAGVLEGLAFAAWLWLEWPAPYFSFVLGPYCALVAAAVIGRYFGFVARESPDRPPILFWTAALTLATLGASFGFVATCMPVGCLSFSISNRPSPSEDVGQSVAALSGLAAAVVIVAQVVRGFRARRGDRP